MHRPSRTAGKKHSGDEQLHPYRPQGPAPAGCWKHQAGMAAGESHPLRCLDPRSPADPRPIVPIVWSSLWSTPLYEGGGSGTLDNFRKLATDPLWWSAVANSLQFAVFATIGSVLVGTTVALLVARTDLPLRKLYSALIVLPLVLPGLVLIVGWQSMWSKNGYATHLLEQYTPFTVPFDLYSVAGMVVMGTVLGSPVVYLFARGGTLSSGDSTLEEAARCAGAGPLRALLSVTLPLLRPALLNSGLLVFALALETLGIPSSLVLPKTST